MKNISRYIAIGFLALVSTSCLDLDPKDTLADPDLWQSTGDFQNFANKFYDYLPDFSQVYDGNIHSDMRSDLMRHKDGNNTISSGNYNMGAGDGDYTNAYAHIRRTTLLIEKAEGYANKMEIRQALGEAYFFRAWSYFGLVQKFGDVILVKHSLDTDDPLLSARRNDRGEVIDFIISDLENAISYLRSVSEIEEGRVSTEGASAFLSRVALYEGTWQKFRGNETRGHNLLDIAAKAAKTVIDSRKYEIFEPASLGNDAYRYMFILESGVKCNPAGLDKSANKEYIIKRCYDVTLKTTGQNLTTTALANAWIGTAKLADMYLCTDGLPTTESSKFLGYDKKRSEWENRDNRMYNTMMRPGDTFWNNAKNYCRIDWTGSEEEMKHAKYTNFTPWASGYFIYKWATERECVDRNESYDFPVLRYAEVLLNYAEAVYERDGRISNEDLNISINKTRLRVNKSNGMPALSNELVNAHSNLDMRTEIRRERTVELFQEGFRIDDLKRWKTAESEMPMDQLGIRWQGEWVSAMANHGGYNLDAQNHLILQSGRVFEQKHYLYPLPVDQQQLNPNLGQNEGWPKVSGSFTKDPTDENDTKE